MDNLSLILILSLLAVILSVGLLAFAVVNADKLITTVTDYSTMAVGCGTTVAMYNYGPFQEERLVHGEALFHANCKTCHAITRKVIGPALVDTFDQRDSLWIVKMIVDGPKLVKSGDSTTVALFNQFDKIGHPRYERFSDNDLSDLMSYLKEVGRAWEK